MGSLNLNLLRKYIAIIILFFPLAAGAQEAQIKIIDSLKRPIEDAAITIWSRMPNGEEEYITKLTGVDGRVAFEDLGDEKHTINVVAFGFHSYVVDSVSFPLTIELEAKAIEIDEAVVVGKLPPQMLLSNGDLSVRVVGTSLENFPNLKLSLEQIPNLSVGENSLSVHGRGDALVILDGKEISSVEQIYSLDPASIKDVRIDSNPSARYDAKYNVVVKITTQRDKSETFGFNAYNSSIFGRGYSDNVGVNIQSNVDKFSSFASYSYKHTELLNYSKVEEVSQVTNTYRDTMSHNRNSHYFAIGTNYMISPKSEVSLDYNFSHAGNSPVRYDATVETYLNDQSQQSSVSDISKQGEFRTRGHNANLFYIYNIDSLSQLIYNVSWANKNTNYLDLVDQNSGGVNDSFSIGNNSISESVMTNLDLSKSLPRAYMLFAGVRYSNINYQYNSTYQQPDNPLSVEQNVSKEQTASVYVEAKKEFDNLNVLLGGRVEWNQNRHSLEGYQDVVFESLNLFPTLKLNYSFSGNFSINGSYTSKIYRPGFQQLTPVITYLTPFSYTVGNPQLRPTISNDIELSSKLASRFNLGVRYTKNRDEIIYTAILDSEDKVAYTSINISDSEYLKYWASYSNKFNFYQLSLYAMLTTPFVEIPFENEIIKANKADVYVSVSNTFSITDRIDVLLNFAYQSAVNRANIAMDPICDLSVGVNYRISKSLSMSFSANDLLFNNYGREYSKYGNVQTMQDYNYDMQRIRLSFNYRFNRLKVKSNSNSYNAQDINRM